MKKECGDEKVDILVVGESIEANLNENKIIVKGIKDGTSQIKINVNGIEYKDIKVMVGWIAIYTEEDLINIKNGLNKSYIIMKDISLTKEWIAIGDNTNQFNGVLEGNYHKISGLNINKEGASNQGLFGYIGGEGQVRNLSIEGTVKGGADTGMLVGYNHGIIENVKVSGEVTSNNSYAGGLVGNSSGTIEKCYSEVTVGATGGNVGGLVGYNVGTIRRSASVGNVIGSRDSVGGLVGQSYSGTIENVYSTGEVSGSSYVGGLVGYLNVGAITNAYSISKVSGKDPAYTGGLLGRSGGGAITNAYWTPEKAGVQTSKGGTMIETLGAMQIQTTYEGFDFTSESPIWVMKTYPELNYNFGGK